MQNGSALSLRERDDSDLPSIVSWVADAEALRLFTGPHLSWPFTAGDLRELTAARGLIPYVVVDDSSHLVGHFDLLLDGNLARLGRVIVDPAQRGRGYARRLVDLAVEEAYRWGASRVRLSVVTSNTRAVHVYRAAGFLAQPPEDHRPGITVMECACLQDGADARVLVTGMSGTGKSTLLRCLARRGFRTLDTDYDEWTLPDGRWDEARMSALLASERRIVISGTVENQGTFFDCFTHVVLLCAPLDVLRERLLRRTDNPYGKTAHELAEIARYTADVEPLLRASAHLELDARRPVEALADEIAALFGG